ncbi:MAG: peptidoglycan DD-metalloendopeptidase family protein [Desulfomonilaceae bacterium]
MHSGLKYLAILIIPLAASCSSTNGLLKRSVALEQHSKPQPAPSETVSHSSEAEDGAFHIVGQGETLAHICDVYGLDIGKVAKMNKIMPPYKLKVGETIFLPATALLKDAPSDSQKTAGRFDKPAGSTGRRVMTSSLGGALMGKRDPAVPTLKFPVPHGILSSPFGYRWGRFHQGLDIAAPLGSPVLACADGRVLFTGSRKGFRRYGNTVLLDHGRGVYTYYAHLNDIVVKKNQKVKRGQRIASVGNTGRSTGPHLHLEVRVVNTMYNPLAYFSPSELTGSMITKRFTESPMGPVRAQWAIPDLLTANQ